MVQSSKNKSKMDFNSSNGSKCSNFVQTGLKWLKRVNYVKIVPIMFSFMG